jgi:hypothetical protein
MSYTYSTFKTALASALVVDETDADFLADLPTIIDNAEQRCYRDLDLVSTSVAVNGTMSINNRYFNLPSSVGHLIVIDAINVFDQSSTRIPLKPVSRDVVDYFWPSDSSTSARSIPSIFARVDDTRVLVGPAPGSEWTAEVVGTIRPTALSLTNTSTFLTTYLSDVFFAAAMTSACGILLKNYGAQSDDPRSAVSWEGEYQSRLASAKNEELRKQYVVQMSTLPASVKA